MNSLKLDRAKTTANPKHFVERRRHKRFHIHDGGIALVTPPGPCSTIVGHILDISLSGLSFRYVSDEGLNERASEVTIASAENQFYLRRLPIQTISDFEIAKMPFGTMSPRRHSLEFGELTDGQTSQLQRFIVNHAVEESTALA
jgi:hypothetical protein